MGVPMQVATRILYHTVCVSVRGVTYRLVQLVASGPSPSRSQSQLFLSTSLPQRGSNIAAVRAKLGMVIHVQVLLPWIFSGICRLFHRACETKHVLTPTRTSPHPQVNKPEKTYQYRLGHKRTCLQYLLLLHDVRVMNALVHVRFRRCGQGCRVYCCRTNDLSHDSHWQIRCSCTPAFTVLVRSRASIARIRSTVGEFRDHTVTTLTRTAAQVSDHMTQSTDQQPTPHSDQRSLCAPCELSCLPPDSLPLGRELWSVPLVLTHPQSYTTRFHSPNLRVTSYIDMPMRVKLQACMITCWLPSLPPHSPHLSVSSPPLLRPNSPMSGVKPFPVQCAVGLLLLTCRFARSEGYASWRWPVEARNRAGVC